MARAGILTCSNTTHDVACSSFGCLNDVNHNKEGFDLLDNAQIEKKHKIIIACSVFEKELQACLPVEGKPEIIWIYAGLHADLPRLEEQLTKVLEESQIDGTEVQVFLAKSEILNSKSLIESNK